MKKNSEEIGESQFGGAQAADDCAAPYNLDDLSTNIRDIRKLVTNFSKDPTEGEDTNEMFFGSLLGLLDKTNEQLSVYKEDLKQNKCIEPFKVSSERDDNDKEDFWKFIDIFFDNIKNDEVYQSLKDKVIRFKSLLVEVENAMGNCDSIVFENYFFRVKPAGIEECVVKQFHRQIYDNLPITSEKLIVMQTKAVIKAIGAGIFDHLGEASVDEVKKVSPDLDTDFVPCGFVVTDDFRNKYALFRRYAYKRGVVLVLDYGKYGKYIVDHKYDFEEEQFNDIYELDVMLREIRLMMKNKYPELVRTPDSTVTEQPVGNQLEAEEELFHFIHPEAEEEEARRIHRVIKRLVAYQKIPEICAYLEKLSRQKKLMLPKNPSFVYTELVRLGMPTSEGYSEKHFYNCYVK